MSVLDDLKKASATAKVSVSTEDAELSATPLLDKLIAYINKSVLEPETMVASVLAARVRHASVEYAKVLEGDAIDKREADAIAEGKKYLAKLSNEVRGNIEAQLGRKLG